MLRSMYSGIAGMKGFQAKLDVVGNNIANVNTVGYKKSRVTFQDLISQTSAGASAPNGTIRGGTNPIQVGTGSKMGSIDVLHTQGFLQTTNNVLDVMIQGDGMFAVTTPTETAYTRAGNFYLDNDSNLVTVDGYFVHDTGGGIINIPDGSKSISIQKDGSVTYVNSQGISESTQKIGLAIFPNPGGLEKIGGNLYRNTANSGNGPEAPTLADPESATVENGAAGALVSGSLEMSNVDLAEEFTEMITAQRGFQANTRIITTSDEILQELVNLKR